jgi:hypothetical protein
MAPLANLHQFLVEMFRSAATLLAVVTSACAVLGAPADDMQKRSVNPSDYLDPHNAARAATGAV